MMFGEIVEPSTRALILDADELDELPAYKNPIYEWQGDSQPQLDIDNLIFADSPTVLQICSYITKNIQPVAQILQEGLAIYKLDRNYLVVFNGKSKDLVVGQLVEVLAPWLRKAQNIHGITSVQTSLFQPWDVYKGSPPITFSRCLTTHQTVPYEFCKRLESPNLIQSFTASILSYCTHSNLHASLWIVYTDNAPLDSENSAELIRLFRTLGIQMNVELIQSPMSSNLYL
ncbi:uncharacterized protein LOC109534643 [Dendroctonus ponderosae]